MLWELLGEYDIFCSSLLVKNCYRCSSNFTFECRYVAPEYACTGMLTEKSDVYGFGILIMEIISGRTPVDYSRPPGEVNFYTLSCSLAILFGLGWRV